MTFGECFARRPRQQSICDECLARGADGDVIFDECFARRPCQPSICGECIARGAFVTLKTGTIFNVMVASRGQAHTDGPIVTLTSRQKIILNIFLHRDLQRYDWTFRVAPATRRNRNVAPRRSFGRYDHTPA